MASNERVGITLDVLPGTFAGVTAALGGFNELVAATSQFSSAIAQSTSVVDAMTLTLGVALVGAAWESAKAFGELERGMKIVQAVSGQTSSQISILTQKANEFSVRYKLGIDDITAGLQTLGRAGLSNVNTQLDTMQAGLQAAKIQGMELNDALEKIVATTALLGGDLKSSNFGQQAEKLTSQLLSTAMTAPIDLNDVVQTLSYSGGTAAAAGINIQNDDALYDYLGAISAFAQKGVKGSMAGTAMRAFFTKPASQDTSVVEAFNKLKMKPSDLWEEGGNAMRPVSEQIEIIHRQMDKLNMSTLDQIELWGKIVGPKMGQQMMKLNADTIKATSREIRQTASATELANMTMDNFLSDVSTLEQKGQRAWRGYGEAALAWIGPVIKGLNGLFDILGTDIGGVPIFQQFVKMGIILVISQVIQKLGAVKNLFVGIVQEIRNMIGSMSRSERTIEEQAAAERKRLEVLGLTKSQADALVNSEGGVTKGLKISNEVLAQFLVKLNEAVALMGELATLSRASSMNMISSISGAQFNRRWGTSEKKLSDGAWFKQHQGNQGNLTKNEFASLSLRHGMSTNDLLKIYDSKKFQAYAQSNQTGKFAFPTAVSLEKYLQENKKGLYNEKTNPIMGIVSNIKTDTDVIATSVKTKAPQSEGNKKVEAEVQKTSKKIEGEIAKQSSLFKQKNDKETANTEKTNSTIQRNIDTTGNNIKRTVEANIAEIKGFVKTHNLNVGVPKKYEPGMSADAYNAAILGRAINDRITTGERRGYFQGTGPYKTAAQTDDGYSFKNSNVKRRLEGRGDQLSAGSRSKVNTARDDYEKLYKSQIPTTSSKDALKALNFTKKNLHPAEAAFTRDTLMQEEYAKIEQRAKDLEAKLSKVATSTEGAWSKQQQYTQILTEAVNEEAKNYARVKDLYRYYTQEEQISLQQIEVLEGELAQLRKAYDGRRKSKWTEEQRNAIEQQIIITAEQLNAEYARSTQAHEKAQIYDVLYQESLAERNDMANSLRLVQKRLYSQAELEVKLELDRYNKKLQEYNQLNKIINDENLLAQAMGGSASAQAKLTKAIEACIGVEAELLRIQNDLKNKMARASASFSTVPGVMNMSPNNRTGVQKVGPSTPVNLNKLPAFNAKNLSRADIVAAADEVNKQAILKNPSLSAQSSGYGAFLGLNAKDQFKAMSASNQAVNRAEIAKSLEIQANNERALAAVSAKNLADASAIMRAKEKEVQFAQNTLQAQEKVLLSLQEQLIKQRKAKAKGEVSDEEIAQTKKEIANIEQQIATTEKEILQLERERKGATEVAATYARNTLTPMNAKTGKRESMPATQYYGGYSRYSMPVRGTYANANMIQGGGWRGYRINDNGEVERISRLNALKTALTGVPEKIKNLGNSAQNASTKLNSTRYYGNNMGGTTGPGFYGSMRNAFVEGFAQSGRYIEGGGKFWNWMNMGMTGMVNWDNIRKANVGLGTLGKVSNIAGGALGSLGMMFGPFEIAMMGVSLVMQGVQAAQQRYKEELEKINSQLSEARENFEKAEEAFLGAYEEQNPNATQDQKDEALLNLYANGPGDRDDGLDSYRMRVFGTLSQIEINTRKKAEKENDWVWGSHGAMQKHFWSPWDETWGWIFDDRKNITRDEWNEQATIARENAAANDQDENEVYGITNHPYNDASFMEQYFKDTFHLEEIDKNLNHYENWVDDLEDYSEQAKYATSIMSQGVDATGPTKDSSWIRTFKDFTQEQLQAGVWGSKNGINDYRKFEESLSKIPDTVKTQIENSINQDPDFYKSMQRQMFTFSNGKLQSRGEKREEKILEAIRRRVGNISAEQAKQTLILATISSINDFVQNQVQPAVLANVDAAMQGTQILGLTNTSVGYTGSSTAAVHQYVMIITSQLGQIVKQKALENASLLAESSGVRFEDLSKLAKEGTGAQGLSKTYTEQDAAQAKQIFESMGQSLYQGPMMTKGMSQEDALKYAKTKFDELNTSGSSLADMLHTWDQWFGFTMTPYIEEQWVKNNTDTTGKASGPTPTDKDKSKDKDSSKDTANKKNWVNLAICNKKEIPKLNVNLFKKPPNFTILNRNFKLRDVNVNTADDAKSIQNAVKNSIIEIQNRSNPKIIQDDAAEYDPINATEGGKDIPTGTKKTE